MSTQPSVLITGVSGFIGRYVARYFSAEGWDVIGIDNSASENAPLANLAAYYSHNLPSTELNTLLQRHQPSLCIHCAGRASVGLSLSNPHRDFYGNTALTFEMLNALHLHAPKCKFIFLSSAAVYGDPQSLPVAEESVTQPLSPYGFHKLASEQICQEFTQIYGQPTAIVRIFSAYGPGLRRQVLWDICQKALTHDTVKLLGTGKESRDFIHALDIAKALLCIATAAPCKGEVYNLGSGRESTIFEISNLLLESLNCQATPEFDGISPPGNPLNWRADISKLESLGFIPSVPLEQGAKVFANWCRAELIGA